MQIGALTAFLSYLMQILMSVMMATFMAIMIPRAAVCAERIGEVLDTESSVRAAGRAGRRGRPRAASWSCATSSSRYPGAAAPVLSGISLPRRAGADDGDHRQHRRRARRRWSSLIPRLFDVTAGSGAGRRRRRPRARPRGAVAPDRPGAAAALPVHRHGRQQPALRRPGRHRRASCGRRSRSPRRATSSRRCRQGWTAPIAQGGTNVSGGQRQRLAIARALVRKPGDLPVRRLVLGARPGDRRAAAGRAATAHPRRRPSSSSRSGCRPSPTPTRSSCSRTARSSASAPTRSCCDTCPTYQEIVESQLSAEEAA